MALVACAQIASVFYNSLASARRVAEHIGDAAAAGASLVVFSESCVPGYPDWAWRIPPRTSSPSAEPFATFQRRFLEQAITVPGPETAIIAEACRAHQIMAAVGVTERPERGGTLYNTLLYFGPDGAIVGRHRKMVPTFAEKLVWGAGDGTTLRTIVTPYGIVGGLICWENMMPLARTALYAQGEQIHVLPNQDSGDRWHASVRHIATEGRMWVLSVGSLMREADLAQDLRDLGVYARDELINPGDSMIVDPLGTVVAGPAHGEETMLYAEAAVSDALLARRGFDAVGHYGRGDLFSLSLNGIPIPLEIGDVLPEEKMSDRVWRVEEPPTS